MVLFSVLLVPAFRAKQPDGERRVGPAVVLASVVPNREDVMPCWLHSGTKVAMQSQVPAWVILRLPMYCPIVGCVWHRPSVEDAADDDLKAFRAEVEANHQKNVASRAHWPRS